MRECLLHFLLKVKDFIHTFFRVIFPFLKKGKGNDSLTLFQKSDFEVELPNFVVYQLFYFCVYLFLSIFWVGFFLKDYDHCIPGDNALQCFSTENETMDELIDCSKNSSANNIICYKFVFAFDEAFTSAGGVFVICTAEFVGIITFLLLISKTQCCKYCSLVVQSCTALLCIAIDGTLQIALYTVYDTHREFLSFFLKLLVMSGAAVIASFVPLLGFQRTPTRSQEYDELTDNIT